MINGDGKRSQIGLEFWAKSSLFRGSSKWKFGEDPGAQITMFLEIPRQQWPQMVGNCTEWADTEENMRAV